MICEARVHHRLLTPRCGIAPDRPGEGRDSGGHPGLRGNVGRSEDDLRALGRMTEFDGGHAVDVKELDTRAAMEGAISARGILYYPVVAVVFDDGMTAGDAGFRHGDGSADVGAYHSRLPFGDGVFLSIVFDLQVHDPPGVRLDEASNLAIFRC